jgi:diamine N-acetyltransferase
MSGRRDETIIRRAGDAEARVLSVLATVTFYEAYFEQDTPIDIANYIADSFAPEQIAAELADPAVEFYIAYRAEKAVGYIKLIRGTEAEGIDTATSLELKRIYVVERFWRQGVGDELLKFAVARTRGLGFEYLWLGVWQENARALGFYAKYGFERVGTITFPYGDSVGINDVLRLKV